ncbi:MAG: hypothetical protein KKB88_00480 [Nanoarchaeota archaeon]|nr:hypothetical protein [Nanoarchaeota archaeon]
MEKERLTKKKVLELLKKCNKMPHYLASKPIKKWDKYDKSNWKSLKEKC